MVSHQIVFHSTNIKLKLLHVDKVRVFVRDQEYEKEREQKGGRKVQTGDNSFGGLCRTLGYVVVSDNDRKVL